jgi:hypothetical protein
MKTARLIAVSRRLTRPMSLGGVRRFAVGRDAIALLQIGAEAVHEPRSDLGIRLKLLRQSLQEGPALEWMDWRCGRLNGDIFVIGKAQRHGSGGSGRARQDGAMRAATARGPGAKPTVFFSQFVEILRRARMAFASQREVFPASNRIGSPPSNPGVAVWRSDNSRS